jgi:hypothetical protein
MTQTTIVPKQQLVPQFNINTRAYFKKDRSPIYGQFVQLNDAKELASKGMIRFIMAGRLESKIFVVNDFLTFKYYDAE